MAKYGDYVGRVDHREDLRLPVESIDVHRGLGLEELQRQVPTRERRILHLEYPGHSPLGDEANNGIAADLSSSEDLRDDARAGGDTGGGAGVRDARCVAAAGAGGHDTRCVAGTGIHDTRRAALIRRLVQGLEQARCVRVAFGRTKPARPLDYAP